jgi:hypothetical protein
MTRTEQTLIAIRDEALRTFPDMPKAIATKIALAAVATAVEMGAPEGYELKADRGELLDVLDTICAKGPRS